MSADGHGHGHTTSRHYDIAGPGPRESSQTIESRLTPSSCTVRSTTPFAWPLGSRGRRKSWHSMMVSKTPRVLLRFTRAVQVFCSGLVLAAGVFSVVKFGIQQQEVLVVKDGSSYVDVDYNSLPDGRGDWRPVLLVALSSVSLIVFPFLAIFRRRRLSVVIEVVLLSLWCSFMTLYVPTILTPFEPNCLRPKAPFEFLDDHTKETLAVGIDIGRNTTGDSSLASASYTNPGKINSEIYTYCVMSQVGVAAGLIVIIFTFLSIVLLLLLSYQATDYLIERRALELLQHHTLPSMVQQGISPISNAYQTITNSLPQLRSTNQTVDEENNFHPHNHNHHHHHHHNHHDNRSLQYHDDMTPVHNNHRQNHDHHHYSKEKSNSYSYSHSQSTYQPTTTTSIAPTSDATTLGATAPTILSNPSTTRTHLEQPENTNHDRIRDEDDSPRPLQLKGWVTQGYQVDRLPSRRQ
ncbi:hypothetical protein TWF225_011434 [Orbilia oligospora]|nr:hypothetical protein TWF225_011434 [Orbilia oligospora]KAF3253255.1 hypothetical protein TWF217_007515 [Orbilia oligospora]KAF3255167.1 hypothetical protein TWF128_005969 [Orbilia oligospora]KAF3298334.1 hypothetical protein TWF132_000161 [Orbilia oligospora]